MPEALDEHFAEGFGTLSVHEVKTDPQDNVNLAYSSYDNAGARVVRFSNSGMVEKGFFIDEGGNHFRGTFPTGSRTDRVRRSCSSATATGVCT